MNHPSPTPSPLCADDVLRFLQANPAFLREHPEIVEWMQPPAVDHGEGVLDFKTHAITALQQRVQDTKAHYGTIIHGARESHRLQMQVQQGVLKLVTARTLEQFFECICIDFPAIFSVDVVRLGLESDMGGYYESYYPEEHYSGMTLIAMGAVTEMFARGHEVRMVAHSDCDNPWLVEMFFHECESLAVSAAYMALTLPQAGRSAVLALGARDAGHFQDGQGTELFRFLAHVAAIRLDYLLYDQAGLL